MKWMRCIYIRLPHVSAHQNHGHYQVQLIYYYIFFVSNFVSEHKSFKLEEPDSLWRNRSISVQHTLQSCGQASQGTS